MDNELMEKFYEAYWFIEEHPAFIGRGDGVGSLYVNVSKCCKRGFSYLDVQTIYRGDERFDEFIGKGMIESLNSNPKFDYVMVQYKDLYGEDWAFDHVEVNLEGGRHFYCRGGLLGNEQWRWDSYHDPDLDCSGRSYEEAIIIFSELVKKKYGDYSSLQDRENSIIPKWIIENNKEHPAFNGGVRNWIVNGMVSINEKHIRLELHEINALWWHLYGESIDVPDIETPDITKYLTRENYELSKL